MKFSIERIYNLERRISGWPPYENLKLRIDEAKTAQEAEKELTKWAEELIRAMREKLEQNQEKYGTEE